MLIDKLNISTMANVVDFLGKSMVLSSMRLSPTFLLSFTCFLKLTNKCKKNQKIND